MLLTTKLTRPAPPPHTVHRQRLYQILDQGWQLGQRLLLIAAPAGYGKTSLLANWLAERGMPCAWLSLDAGDNDPARFFTYLAAALQPHLPGVSESVLPAINAPRPPEWGSLLASLLNAAVGLEQPTCLVLDDAHLLTTPVVSELLRGLIEGLPPNLRLVLLTRADPALPLARLRARQQMSEVRERELRFTLEESQSWLCEKMALPLHPDHLATLQARTEGWAVGLQLAALSFRQSPDPEGFLLAFNGTHRYVIDYLLDEVLSGLEPELRRFLCETAVLERLCAPLCAAVLEDDPQEAENQATVQAHQVRLEWLERQNLFLLPLDEQRRWYRYHHLLADLLRSETPAERQAILQHRAAVWLAAHQQPAEAVGYALAAARNSPADTDYKLAAQLIRQAALPAAENGQLVTALGWLAALPEGLLLAQPDLAIDYGWFRLYNGQIKETGAWLERLQAARPDMTGLSPLQQALLVGLSAWQRMAMDGKFDFAAFRRVQELLEAAPTEPATRLAGAAPGDSAAADRYFRPLLLLALGQAALATGGSVQARQHYETALALAEASNSQVTTLILSNNLAFLRAACGEQPAALDMCREAYRRYCSVDGRPSLLAGIPAIPLGVLEYRASPGRGGHSTVRAAGAGAPGDGNPATNSLDDAYAHLSLGLSLARRLGMYDVLANPANQSLALLLCEQGQVAEAFQLVDQVERQAGRIGMQIVVSSARATRAELALHQGQPGMAEQWAAECGLPPVDPHDLAAVAAWAAQVPTYGRAWLLLARLWIAQGHPQAALVLLTRLEVMARAAGCLTEQVDTQVARTQAWLCAGNLSQARQVLAAALDLAAPQEYRQPFRWALSDHQFAGLLHTLAGHDPGFVASLAGEMPETTVEATGGVDQPPAAASPGLQAIIDPPGEREREILRLVACGLSNQEIADRLYLTTGTVKWYLNQTYRKLGVSSRTQAVALGRQIGIV